MWFAHSIGSTGTETPPCSSAVRSLGNCTLPRRASVLGFIYFRKFAGVHGVQYPFVNL